MLQSLITDVQNDQTIDQEKLWTMFHEIRTSPLFQSDWKKIPKSMQIETRSIDVSASITGVLNDLSKTGYPNPRSQSCMCH